MFIKQNEQSGAICKGTVTSDGVLLKSKGIDGINSASRERGDTLVVAPGDTVHKDCQPHFCHPSNV